LNVLLLIKRVIATYCRAGENHMPEKMPKKIIVFADGTGNAFSTQESNVWRLYEALDQTQPDQIAHYIKGVGTSGFKPLALLDGATGFGVPSNVRKLYEFICWNWEEGDEIYMFGFSRGAFTIRTLTGLIQHEGLIPVSFPKDKDQGQVEDQDQKENVSHAEMRRNVMMAWRAYRSKTGSWTLPTIWLTRRIRDAVIGIYHHFRHYRSYAEVEAETKALNRDKTKIKFVGLFDTVEAYGVPLEELRRAINIGIWPISFKNGILCGKVETARHALSLDDERVTFHPLRFDMKNSENPGRIKEVWFAGVHSDVGGGYPEDDLAQVPLTWMIGELGTSLRFIDGAKEVFINNASPYAAAHDSRGGLSVFYRYGPRTVGDNGGHPPVIHHSVAEKIAFGIERYAPVTLPDTAQVLMPDGSLERIKGYTSKSAWLDIQDLKLSRQMKLAQQAVEKLNKPDRAIVALTVQNVRRRRFAYSWLLFTVIVIASLPWTVRPAIAAFRDAVHTVAGWFGLAEQWDRLWVRLANADQAGSASVGSVFDYVGSILPGYAKPWADALIDRPTVCGIVIIIAFLLYLRNSHLRDRIAELARQAWVPNEKTDDQKKRYDEIEVRKTQPSEPIPDALVKNGSQGAGFMASIKCALSEYVLPVAAVLLIYAAIGVLISRATVTWLEGGGYICEASKNSVLEKLEPGKEISRDDFTPDKLCWASRVSLKQGQHYTVWIDTADHPFFDQALMIDVAGFEDSSWRHLLALPIRRWWSADWFQPIARIGNTGIDAWPLVSADGDTAVPTGQDAAGNPMPKHFYEFVGKQDKEGYFQKDPDNYAPRLEQLKQLRQLKSADAPKDPSALAVNEKIPDAELPFAKKIREKYALRSTYVSNFTARSDGELFLYVNDAIAAVPFWKKFTCFYDNNAGLAKVTIKHLSSPPPPPP
jgi:uncharacterized protein (DUF2235 family)